MCGIFLNYLFTKEITGLEISRAQHFVERLKRRGPDRNRIEVINSASLILGHSRLSIIDLNSTADQPFTDIESRFKIVFNGEIYNYLEIKKDLISLGHQFKTASDTEVLLKGYQEFGAAILEKIDGMYAFAIFDVIREEVFIARDQYGIKPLYYELNNDGLTCSSQLKPFVTSAFDYYTEDTIAWSEFETWGSFQGINTPLNEVKVFPAGSYCLVKKTGKILWNSFTHHLNAKPLDNQSCDAPNHQINVITKLKKSVSQQLRADTQIGILLSAGFDSTLIASIAQKEFGYHLPAITLGFYEYKGTTFDEVPLAKKTCDVLNLPHHIDYITKNDFLDSLDAYFDDMDMPTIDGLNTWLATRTAKKFDLKVVLSGLGADELFGGYPIFKDLPKIRKYHHLFQICNYIPGINTLLRNHPNKKLQFLKDFSGSYKAAYYLHRVAKNSELDRSSLAFLRFMERNQKINSNDPAELITFLELQNYMQNQLLRDSDWASMSHGVELRVPFLSKLLMGMHLPSGKANLISDSKDSFLQDILSRPKTGFSVPTKDWLLQERALKETGNSTQSFISMIKEQWISSLA